MAVPLTLGATAEETQYQAQAQQYLEEMTRLREQMQQSRRETDSARGETGSLMAQINALFGERVGEPKGNQECGNSLRSFSSTSSF